MISVYALGGGWSHSQVSIHNSGGYLANAKLRLTYRGDMSGFGGGAFTFRLRYLINNNASDQKKLSVKLSFRHNCSSDPAGVHNSGSTFIRLRRYTSPVYVWNMGSALFTSNNEGACHISTGDAYQIDSYSSGNTGTSNAWISIPDYT